MNDTHRFIIFLSVVLGLWTGMHVYVITRVWALPGFHSPAAHRALLSACFVLWASYPLGRLLASGRGAPAAYPLELVGALWMGVLFLSLSSLLTADVLTGFGRFLPRLAFKARWAALGVAGVLSVVALAQGLRLPVVRNHEVVLPGLPQDLDGKVLVQLTDLHLGTLLRERWLGRILKQVETLRPDILVITGDLVDGNAAQVESYAPLLKRFQAPLGVWFVTGNHEFYAGLSRSLQVIESAGFEALRDRTAQIAPGLNIAGVDDLTARKQFGLEDDPMAAALAHRPEGPTILLSHSPLLVEEAAERGADLMLCGHTHDGQIWPFNYIVKRYYPYIAGRYDIKAMTLVVSRGTGTWGPPMRLFLPGEVQRIVLRSGPPRTD
ncbi:MAG: metallophosphoesterase [Elusimicrobia bacterium]|nr:metallophosphoesterase [Elusimicrobiota bacterium]